MRLRVTVLVVAMAAGVSSAGTYYVAPTGSNTAAGTDAAPWATLQHAADVVHAGDTVIVRAGEYQGFDLETSGTAGSEIVFRTDGDVKITSDNPVTSDGINLEGASYVRIEGFSVIGATRAGI